MGVARARRRGFSLTEILMAVGILGIGMTMVASIYPVAIDQTRRGTDATMAALCARSMAALIRAKRTEFVMGPSGCRSYFKTLLTNTDTTSVGNRERPAEFGITETSTSLSSTVFGILDASANATGIRQSMRVYNPNLFLYEAGRRYVVDAPLVNAFWPMWNAGNYVPVVYVTPIAPHTVAASGNPANRRNDSVNTSTASAPFHYNNAQGPWRVTIVVFKSRGHVVPTGAYAALHAQGDTLHPRTRTWAIAKGGIDPEPPFAAGAGDFIIDRNIHAGEAYQIDAANLDASTTDPPIYLACGKRADTTTTGAPTDYLTSSNSSRWYVLPGAVMAFHTIIGD